jgi:hypothetical protein
VNVAVPPFSRFTDAARLPLPLAGHARAGTLAAHVHVAPVTFAGKLSVTVAAVTALGAPRSTRRSCT